MTVKLTYTCKRFLLFAATTLISLTCISQVAVTGTVFDENNEALPGAIVKVMSNDSALITGTVTGIQGEFKFTLTANTRFTLVFALPASLGKNKFLPIETKTENITLPKIKLKETVQQLEEVQVAIIQTRGEQKGDTTSFNANAYKTNPDAVAEDLVKKIPGITSDSEGIKVNGETVQKVLVDGKPFFGDDPNATLKNLPAEIIEKVQVFDKMSDQAQFSGFNDGEQQKTINLVTKKDKNQGYFGRVYGGAGIDQDMNARYNTGANLNSFNNKRRLSLLLLSNNVNQQNFATSDITGAMGNTGNSNRSSRQGGSNFGGSGNLITAAQNGNSVTRSAGLNYSDSWGNTINVSGSYFYNYTDNKNASNLSRNYFSDDNLAYIQNQHSSNLNQNHRANFRLEYAPDSANKLTITPSLNLQDNRNKTNLFGGNTIDDGVFHSSTQTNSENYNLGYDFSNNLLLQHKFKTPGRTVSANILTSLSERNNNGNYYSANMFTDTSTILNQEFKTFGNTKKTSVSFSYTEPLNKNAQLLLSYNPSYSASFSNKNTSDVDADNITSHFNPELSNKYNTIYNTQKGGLGLRYNKDKLMFSFGADMQQAILNGNQVFPTAFSINNSFNNVLPNAQFNYRFNRSKNLRINYRSSTNIPSVSQLQNALDISNPLQLQTGNPDLKQTFANNLSIRFGGFDSKTSRNIMLFVNGSTAGNYISNATYMFGSDTVIQSFNARAGTQLTKPVNLNGYFSGRAFFVYGFPLKPLKSNLNFNGGINYSHIPGIILYKQNISNNYAPNAGIYIGSNISANLDFSLGYNGNYTVVKNTTNKQSNNNYFTHTGSFKVNWIFWKGVVLNTDVTHTLYNGLSQNFNQQYFLWNAYVGYKFLKNKSLEVKISLFDILNQNRSINRTVTGAYTEDSYTSVLRRYTLFTLTYSLRNFKNGTPPKNDELEHVNPLPGERPPIIRHRNNSDGN